MNDAENKLTRSEFINFMVSANQLQLNELIEQKGKEPKLQVIMTKVI